MILIVESDLGLAERLRRSLQDAGHEAHAVADGLEALRWLRGATPELILMDQSAPWMDGFRVCRLIKFHRKRQQIPVFLMTLVADQEHHELARMVGSDGYIEIKNPQDVAHQVHQFLSSRPSSPKAGLSL